MVSLVSYTVINRRQHKVCDRLEQKDSEALFCKGDQNGLHFQNLYLRKKTCQFTKLMTDKFGLKKFVSVSTYNTVKIKIHKTHTLYRLTHRI